jgi:hypothetical protein
VLDDPDRRKTLTRAIATFTSGLAALALAGCGSSSSPTPVQVGEQWYRATARVDGEKLCQLSTAQRQRRFLEIAHRLPGGAAAKTCAAAVELTLAHYGGSARLAKFANVRVRLVSQSKTTAEVQAENAVPLKLVRSGASWLIAEPGAGSG